MWCDAWVSGVTKVVELDYREPAVRGGRVTLRCRRTPPKTDRHPRMAGSEFWGWDNDEIGPATPMTGYEKPMQSQASSRSTGYAADLSQTSLPPMSAIWICRGQSKGSFMEPRCQSGDHHLVSSTAGMGLAFRKTEIRLWARCWQPPQAGLE